MHRRSDFVRSLSVAGVMLSVLAAGTATAAPRQELEAIYAKFTRLVSTDDKPGITAHVRQYTTGNFVQVMPSGRTLNRDQTIAAITQGPAASMRFTSYQWKLVSLTTKGVDTIVVYKDRTTARLVDGQGKEHAIETTSTARDIWVKTASGWRTRKSTIQTARTTVDGKEVPS